MGRRNKKKNKTNFKRISMQTSEDASKFSNNTSVPNGNKVTADTERITNLLQQMSNTAQKVASETKIAENHSADMNLLIDKEEFQITNGNTFNVSFKNAVPDSRAAISSKYIINPRERLWQTDNKWYVKVLPTASSSSILTKEQIACIYQRFGKNFTDHLKSPLLTVHDPSTREINIFYNMDFLDKTNVVKNLAAISSRVFEAQMFAGFKIINDFDRLKSNMPSINMEHVTELFEHYKKVFKELGKLEENEILPNNKKIPAFSKKPRVVRVKFINHSKSSVKVILPTSVQSTSWSVLAQKKLQKKKAIYCPSTLTSDSVLTNDQETSTQKTLNRNYFEELNLLLRNNECASTTTSDKPSNYDGIKPKSSSVDQSSNENTTTNLNFELKSNQHRRMTLNKPLDYGTYLLSTSSDHRYNENISEELDMLSTTPNKFSDYVHQKLESKRTDKFSDKINDDISSENITSPTCVQFADHSRQHNTLCKPITINTESFDFENLKTSIQVDNLSSKTIAYKENSYDKQLGSTKEKTIRLKLAKSSVKSIKNKLKIGNIEDFSHLFLEDVKNLLKKTKCKKIYIKIDTKETRKNLTKMAVFGEDTSESLWEDISEPVSEDDNSELINAENSKYNKTDIKTNTKQIKKYVIKKDNSRENSSESHRSNVSEPFSEKGNKVIGTKNFTENLLKYNANKYYKYFVDKINVLKSTLTDADNIKTVSIDDASRNIPKDNNGAMKSINSESQTDPLIFKNLQNDVEYFIKYWNYFFRPLPSFVNAWNDNICSKLAEENHKPKDSDLNANKSFTHSSSKIQLGGVAVNSSNTYVKTSSLGVSNDKVKIFSQLSTGNKTVYSTSERLETDSPLRNESRESSLKSSTKNQSTVKERSKNKTEKISANENKYSKVVPPRDIYKWIFHFNSRIKLLFEHLKKLYTQIIACLNRCEWVMYVRPFLQYLEEKQVVLKNCYMLIEKVIIVFEKSRETALKDLEDMNKHYRLLVAHFLLTKTYFSYVMIYSLILKRFLRSCYENNHKLTTIKEQ